MPRDPYPHEELVQELRRILCGMRSTHSISDDMDQFYTGSAGYSPMEQIMEQNALGYQHAEAISRKLVDIGPSAADAVALGLRMQGTWREHLLPYVRAHRRNRVISDAVRLVRKRQNDPLKNAI